MQQLIELVVRHHEASKWCEEALLQAEREKQRWTLRRRICGRLAIVASLPLGYLVIVDLGLESLSVKVILGLWALAMVAIFACSTVIAHAEGRIAGLPTRSDRQRLFPID